MTVQITRPLAVIVLWIGLGATAPAQDYPSNQIRIIVPFVAGGTTDFLGRLAADYISGKIGRQVIVENRSGAAGSIGMEAAAKAEPDGHTLFLGNTADIIINRFLYKQVKTDPLEALTPIAFLTSNPQLLAINSKLPAKTVQEFIAYAKERPGQINYGSAGHGTTMHIGARLFSHLAGLNLTHVPYRGSAPALTDMMAGQVQMVHISLQPIFTHVQSGAIRVLVVAQSERWGTYLPNIPSAVEAGLPGYETGIWFGLFAPRSTPQPIIDRLNGYMREMIEEPLSRKRLADSFLQPAPRMSAKEFGAFIGREVPRWERIVRETGVTVE